MSRKPDLLGSAVAIFMILCMIVGCYSILLFSYDLIHQVSRVCQ